MCNDELEIRRLAAELKQREVDHQNQIDALQSQIRLHWVHECLDVVNYVLLIKLFLSAVFQNAASPEA